MEAVESLNAKYPLGTPVTYRPFSNKRGAIFGHPVAATIRKPFQWRHLTIVVWVSNRKDYIPASSLIFPHRPSAG